MVTLKEIAELSGVSRGTVDRVINNRGSVKPETAERVRAIAKRLDYRPNKVGRALAAQKKKYKLGAILFSKKNPFFDDVVRGVKAKADELKDYDVSVAIRQIDYSLESQINTIDEMVADGISGLVITPYNNKKIQAKIDELVSRKIPVVTVNSDIEKSSRIAYVGSDYFLGGKVAAGLFALMTQGDINLGIITGSSEILCHTERINGLRQTLENSYPRIHIVDIRENLDDQIISYSATKEMLLTHPEINALFFTASGVHGGCRAVQELNRKPRIISFDEVPSTVEMLKEGVISVSIGQQPYWQGSTSLGILFDYLSSGTLPENELNYSEPIIRIRENLI